MVKRFLSSNILTTAAEHGISTIVINEALSDDSFSSFIQSTQQPAIVLFDEFEKIYRPGREGEMELSCAREQRRQMRVHSFHPFRRSEQEEEDDVPYPS